MKCCNIIYKDSPTITVLSGTEIVIRYARVLVPTGQLLSFLRYVAREQTNLRLVSKHSRVSTSSNCPTVDPPRN